MITISRLMPGTSAVLATCAFLSAANAQTVLIYTDESPNAGSRAVATNWFFQELERRTNGEVRVDPHWGGALMRAAAAAEGIGSGAADMGLVIAFYNPSLNHTLTLGDIPTEYHFWVSTRAMYDLATTHPEMIREYDNLNIRFLANITTGPIQLLCNRTEVRSIADMAGRRIRGTSLYGRVAESLGAINVSMPVYDVYQALDTGVIDCTMNYNYAVRALRHDEVSSSLTLLDWGTLGGLAYVINADVYNDLSPQNQQILDELSSEFVDYYVRMIMDADTRAIEEMRAGADGNNVQLIEFPAEEKALLLEASQPYMEAWRVEANRQGFDGDAVIAAYREALERRNAEMLADGLPWERQ